MPISKIKTSSITADAASTNLNIDANTLYLDAANNRVGIGTTSPGATLQVQGATTLASGNFTVDTAGVSINFFGGTKGTWAFDNNNAPSSITFTPIDAAAFTLNLGGPIRPSDNLKISKLVKAPCKGDTDGPGAVMSFVLTFNRK